MTARARTALEKRQKAEICRLQIGINEHQQTVRLKDQLILSVVDNSPNDQKMRYVRHLMLIGHFKILHRSTVGALLDRLFLQQVGGLTQWKLGKVRICVLKLFKTMVFTLHILS
ncbi:MAG: hypothetical protein EZS28_030761 [Streblomastix strix]|uniref:Uncharacterized protein n=1 Tax=Streblomastix strix TaxID=222440 RepID=A0A5J4UUJ5_9EUKA|nr:MAG: hypothetical protein EZS28_030761 [Streblomastix strix]